MSSSPPLPPPPPPPLSHGPPRLPVPNLSQSSFINSSSFYNLDACKWAAEHFQLQEACVKFNICLYDPPHKFQYKHFAPVTQIGPTCGLVALSMLVNGAASPDEILGIVKVKGYSCNGEMFSCKDMVKLTENVFSLAEIQDVRCTLKIGGLCSDEIVEKLLDGAVLLLPYDADANHSPCLKQGHTAHWALICGVIVVRDLPDGPTSDPDNTYVLARHGKSKYLAAWRLDELGKSNKNLWEFSPKKGADNLTYVLPEGGVGGSNGLRNQYLVFEGLR